jgi:protein SMG6
MYFTHRSDPISCSATRPRDRAERPPPQIIPRPQEKSPIPSPSTSPNRVISTSPRKPHPSPHTIINRPEADPDDFSRRLKISSSPAPRTSPPSKHHNTKLFNPETDPIPMRYSAEPESISDTTSSSYVPRRGPNSASRDVPPRQLFDHRKDDPVRFAVLARPHGRPTPTPKSSADYLSASSTSSYANSVTSSNFTLSSNTDDSSASSALFERQGKPNEESGNNIFAVQLKRLYRTITTLEDKIKQEDVDEGVEESRIMLKGKEVASDEFEKEKWKKHIENHKRCASSFYASPIRLFL